MYKYFQFVLLFYFSPPPSIYIVHQGTQSIKPCDFELNPRIEHNLFTRHFTTVINLMG